MSYTLLYVQEVVTRFIYVTYYTTWVTSSWTYSKQHFLCLIVRTSFEQSGFRENDGSDGGARVPVLHTVAAEPRAGSVRGRPVQALRGRTAGRPGFQRLRRQDRLYHVLMLK